MEKFERRAPGLRAARIALEPETSFEAIVEQLKQVLTIGDLKGCGNCLSGFDRIIIDSTVFERINERTLGV
jgi:hypothetical protein